MIYGMGRDIADALRARGFPLQFHYGPEAITREGHPAAVVLMRDMNAADTFEPPRGFDRNPRKIGVRILQAVALIFAQSSRPGAHLGDHEELCESFVDAYVTALEDWATAGRTEITIRSAQYVRPVEVEHEHFNGVVYELRFGVARGVNVLRYTRETESDPVTAGALPTGAATGVRNSTLVRIAGREDEDPDTGCGAE